MGGRELKSGGADVFEREKVGEGNETSGWIAVCAGGREGGSVRPRPDSNPRRLSVVTQKPSLKRQQSKEAKNRKYLTWYLIFINLFNLYSFA